MSNRIRNQHVIELQTKMVVATFSPVGAPRSCEHERYVSIGGWIDGISGTTSEQGGENHAR